MGQARERHRNNMLLYHDVHDHVKPSYKTGEANSWMFAVSLNPGWSNDHFLKNQPPADVAKEFLGTHLPEKKSFKLSKKCVASMKLMKLMSWIGTFTILLMSAPSSPVVLFKNMGGFQCGRISQKTRPQGLKIISDATTPSKTNGWTWKKSVFRRRCSIQLLGIFGVSIIHLSFPSCVCKITSKPQPQLMVGKRKHVNMTQQLTSSHFDRRSTPSLGLYCYHPPGAVLEAPNSHQVKKVNHGKSIHDH